MSVCLKIQRLLCFRSVDYKLAPLSFIAYSALCIQYRVMS